MPQLTHNEPFRYTVYYTFYKILEHIAYLVALYLYRYNVCNCEKFRILHNRLITMRWPVHWIRHWQCYHVPLGRQSVLSVQLNKQQIRIQRDRRQRKSNSLKIKFNLKYGPYCTVQIKITNLVRKSHLPYYPHWECTCWTSDQSQNWQVRMGCSSVNKVRWNVPQGSFRISTESN